jgi:hypothetical protein
MKLNRIFLFITLSFFLFVGCEESYLDDPAPTSSVNSSVVFSSKAGVEAFISGIHRRARAQFIANTHQGGLYSMYYARDVKANDILTKATWYLWDYDHTYRAPTYGRTKFSWEFPYYMINQANIGIKGLNESTGLAESDKNELMAQFLGLRGFYYFQLALEFNHHPTYDPKAKAPPIYTEPATDSKPMSTITELFTQIKKDLSDASTMASSSRINKTYLNKNVIEGFKARVHLYLREYAEAEASAAAARSGFSVVDSEYGDGFNDMSMSEVIWAMAQTTDQSNYYYIAPHVFSDHENGPYQGTFFNNDFVQLFSETDSRNTFYHYYSSNTSAWFAWVTSKFTFAFDSDMIMMRAPEMMLIEAEAKARQAKYTEAATLLETLQTTRDASAVSSGNTGQDLIDEIMVERRKELYCELGVEWFDAKRMRTGIKRTGNHRVFLDLEPDDKRFILCIPQSEIDANEYIDDSINTARL